MADTKDSTEGLSEGECTEEDSEEDLDTSACKVCNLTFKNPKAFYSHIYSVSHLQKTSQNLSSTSTTSSTMPATPVPLTTTVNMPAAPAGSRRMCMVPPPPPPCPPPPPPPPVERPEPVSQNFSMFEQFDSHAVTMSDMYSMSNMSMFHPVQSTMTSLFSPASFVGAMAMPEMQYMYSSQGNIPFGNMPLPRPPRMSDMTPRPPQIQPLMSLSTSPWKNPSAPVPEVASSISHVPSLFSLPASSMHSGNLMAPPPPPPLPQAAGMVTPARSDPYGVPAPIRPQPFEAPASTQPQPVGVPAPSRPQPVARPEPVPAPTYLQPYGVSAPTQPQPVGVPPPSSVPAAVQSSSIPQATCSEMHPVSSSADSSSRLSAENDSNLPASNSLIQSEMKTENEPIIDGHWIIVPKKTEDTSESFSCQPCSMTCTGKLLYDLHMAGLRHMKNTSMLEMKAGAGEASASVADSSIKQKNVGDMNTSFYQSQSNYSNDQPQTSAAMETSNIGKKMKLNDFVERNVDLYKQLNSLVETSANLPGLTVDSTPSPLSDVANAVAAAASETVGKKMTVANILERNVDLLQKLSCYVEPVLGTDYITEYRFIDSHVEHVCHLCETTLNVPINLTEHSCSITHLIRYIFYHEPSSFKLLTDAGQCSDKDAVYRVAADIEKKSGRQLRTRVSMETATPTEFGQPVSGIKQTHWVEQKDDLIRPLSGLPGHALNAPYNYQHPPDCQSPIKDFPSLLQVLGRHSCCASGKPPSLAKTVSRMDLLSSLAVFDVSNDSDAEVSLQIANTLTLALLSYRMQMLPTLRPMDRLKFEPKISKLYEEAELVGSKTGSRSVLAETTTVMTS